jgi:hypothetical protein
MEGGFKVCPGGDPKTLAPRSLVLENVDRRAYLDSFLDGDVLADPLAVRRRFARS